MFLFSGLALCFLSCSNSNNSDHPPVDSTINTESVPAAGTGGVGAGTGTGGVTDTGRGAGTGMGTGSMNGATGATGEGTRTDTTHR